ncbi:hypothetical protein GA0115251_11952 [Streptomyces sp. TverLS-915]|uniref:hypothetical protein n=1 Tax=Streptomyces sp. TverLS-915 TaxID=1839763 RepID=UPI00081E84D8|nr:hypothetical protein [Streptomyces sp. TverLS-915]SCD70468.1 hypothetical protein GA0115251_11952 [Streptomyces sp. TverLS-915]
MPSVVGLLEQQELAAHRRVDRLREGADRIRAELAMAEQEWLEWTIARERAVRCGAVRSAPGGDSAESVVTGVPGGAITAAEVWVPPPVAARTKSQVPMRREGAARTALAADYQRILAVLADRIRLGQGPLTCQEMVSAFGMDVVPAEVEALRSKAERLVAHGWLNELQPGRFTLAQHVTGPSGAS